MKKTSTLIALFFSLTIVGRAHTLPVSDVILAPDENYVHLELLMNPFDLAFFSEIDGNHNRLLDPAELTQHQNVLTRKVLESLRLDLNGRTLHPEVAGTSLSLSDHHLILKAHYPIVALGGRLSLHSRLNEITHAGHLTRVQLIDGSRKSSAVLDARSVAAEFTLDGAPPSSLFSLQTVFSLLHSPKHVIVLLALLALLLFSFSKRHRGGSVWLRFGLLAGMAAMWVGLSLPEPQPTPGMLLGAAEGEAVVWRIGKPDGSSIEFAPGTRPSLTFTIGQSKPEKDFAGHQEGSTGFDPAAPSVEKPYDIVFDLTGKTADSYRLVADLIYPSGAPQQMKVRINDREGLFPIEPIHASAVDSNAANSMLLARQQLVVPIPGGWLKAKANRISLVPLGIGSLNYDCLTLEKAAQVRSSGALEPSLEPTLFYREKEGRLLEICRLRIPFERRYRKGLATIQLGAQRIQQPLTPPNAEFGVQVETLEIPAPDKATTVELKIELDGKNRQVRQTLSPARKWTVYICPKVHNDVGYTDIQPHVNELDTRNTDTVLDILEKFPFFKFNFETAWLVDNYLDTRPPKYRQLFFDWAAKGRATVNVFYLNLLTGLCSGEELHRAMYYTHKLHREHGSNFDFACLTDAPSHTWFLPSLLSGVGVKAFSNGSNQTRAPILHHSSLNEDSPFYWEGINGERVMMWYARSYSQWKRLTGPGFVEAVASYDYLKTSVPQFLLRYLRDDYPFDAVMVYGAYVDNAAVPETAEAPLIERWNQEFKYPKLVVGSDADYFDHIQKRFANQLKVYRGDAGAYWEDGAASTAQATTLNRQSQQILLSAETLASLATLLEPRFRYPAEEFWSAWRNVMFYDEHTWGAYTSTQQPDRTFVTRQWEIKESYATRANLDARNLLARGMNRLCQQMAVEGDTIFAFNLQNTARTAPLEVEINKGQHLVDLSTQRPVPLDVVMEKDGWRQVRFLADNVPAFGYKGYALRSLEEPSESRSHKEDLSGQTIENTHYRLTVEPRTGAIRSLVDKASNKELVDPASPYGLNRYLYVSGGHDTRIIDNVHGRPAADLQIEPSALAHIVENLKTPLGQRLVVESRAKNTPLIRTEYILYDRLKRVDIHNFVNRTGTRENEAIYFAFPFAARQPELAYQIQNGWVRPNRDQLPGACREWFTTQNLTHVKDGNFSIALATPDSPLITLTDINRGKWLKNLEMTNGHVFSYVMNNYWFTNYKAAQSGGFQFRYFITSGEGMGAEQLGGFDAETRDPVLAYPLLSSFSASVAQTDRPFAAASGSFLTVESPTLQVVVLKEAEDHDGFILRLRETGGRSGEAELAVPILRLREAFLCNGVEVNQQELNVTSGTIRFPYQANQYVTLRLKGVASVGK
ncbi:MAG: polysaccharide lyase family protein [Acidobacteriota bacterium]